MCTNTCTLKCVDLCVHIYIYSGKWFYIKFYPSHTQHVILICIQLYKYLLQSWGLILGFYVSKSSGNVHILNLYRQQFCEHNFVCSTLKNRIRCWPLKVILSLENMYFLNQTCKVMLYCMNWDRVRLVWASSLF